MKAVTGLFSLGVKDLVKGFVVTILASILSGVVTILNSGTFPTDFSSWKPTLIAGVTAGISYLLKNFFTNNNDQLLKSDVK